MTDLRTEVHAIVDRLSHDELRVLRFTGRRMIDIGHAKYGPLDIANDRRDWLKEYAEEVSDGEFFYRPLIALALADREQERKRAQSDPAFAQVAPHVTASFVIDDTGVHEVLMAAGLEMAP